MHSVRARAWSLLFIILSIVPKVVPGYGIGAQYLFIESINDSLNSACPELPCHSTVPVVAELLSNGRDF